MSQAVCSEPTYVDGLPHQTLFWSDRTQDQRTAMVGPLGCGKSLALCHWCLQRSYWNNPLDGLLVVPTYNLFRMVHLGEWPEIMSRVGVELIYHGQDSAFVWPWGSRTWVRSAEHPQRLAGPNLAYVAFDEPGQMRREAWERGTVRARHAGARVRQVGCGGTPEGLNWFADVFGEPQGRHRTIWAGHWHPDLGDYYRDVIEPTYGYDESLLAAYGKGAFVPMRQGRCYRQFLRAVHCDPKPVYVPRLPLVVACDFNVDVMRWCIGQRGRGFFHWIDEIALGKDSDTEKACKEVVARYGRKHVGEVIVTGDSSGQARSTSGRTDYQIIREEFAKIEGWSVTVRHPRANPRQKDRVDTANYHLSGRGLQIRIAWPECRELVVDLERVLWRQGSAEIDKSDPDRTHATDAWSMGLWSLAPLHGLSGARVSISRNKLKQPDVIMDMQP